MRHLSATYVPGDSDQPMYALCVSVSGTFQGSRLVDTVGLPVGLPSPSAPSLLALILPYGSLTSVPFFVVGICICFSQLLGRAYQRTGVLGSCCKQNIASIIVSGIGAHPWNGSQVGTVKVWPVLESLFYLCPCKDSNFENENSHNVTLELEPYKCITRSSR